MTDTMKQSLNFSSISTRARLALLFEPTIKALAADPGASTDPDGGDLALRDQLIGSAAGHSNDPLYLRNLQVLVLLVHLHLRASPPWRSRADTKYKQVNSEGCKLVG
jgi:hypothetical protein